MLNAIKSILQSQKALIALEIKVISHGGLVIYFDHVVIAENPPDLFLEVGL
jgi:hypothetical protein